MCHNSETKSTVWQRFAKEEVLERLDGNELMRHCHDWAKESIQDDCGMDEYEVRAIARGIRELIGNRFE